MAPQVNSPLTSGTGYKLVKLGETAMRYAEDALRSLGIKPRHFNVLAAIADHPEFSQKEISTTIGIDPNIMVGVIDELEHNGLAIRRRSSTDRRKYVLEVTTKEHALLKEGLDLLAKGEEKFFAVLSPQQKQTFNEICIRLLDANY